MIRCQRVLLVDDDAAVRDALSQTLELADFDVTSSKSFIEAIDHIAADFSGVIISDIRMPGKDGFELLERARAIDADLPVILLTGEGDVPSAVRAMNDGAYDYLEKPCPPKRLVEVVTRALAARRLVLDNREMRRRLETGDAADRRFLGVSDIATDLRKRMRRIAASDADVLIVGETGTGKELCARIIHDLSRPDMPFVAVNCSLLQAAAARETLFGSPQKTGAFARADGGTLFLHEIGAMPVDQQAGLLRILEDRALDLPDGSRRSVNVRVIASTHENLDRMQAEGAFRRDLFFRLDVARLTVPPLRERIEDAPVLFRVFCDEASDRFERQMPTVGAEHLGQLMVRRWPGNVRELRNHAQRLVMGLQDGDQSSPPMSLSEKMDQVEATLISDSLLTFRGRITQVCAHLGLPRKTLYDKMKRYGLRPEAYRD